MKKVSFVLMALVGIGALVVPLTRGQGPSFQGRPLSLWVGQLGQYHGVYDLKLQKVPEFKQAEEAIRAIGTNGLPYLRRWIRQEPPFWSKPAHELLPRFALDRIHDKICPGPGGKLADGAMWAFNALGSNAASTVPQLARLMWDTNQPTTAYRALTALGGVGAAAFPHIVSALGNTNFPDRSHAATILFQMAPFVGTNACIGPLASALNDPDRRVRAQAHSILARLAAEPLTNAPAK